MYTYSFDDTRAEDWRLPTVKYRQIYECYILLLKKIEEWNQVAIAHGATEPPYKKEADDLQRMIDWGTEQLRDKDRSEVMVRGISVGSLRYAKAALIYAAGVREAEAQSAAKPDWPASVRAAMGNIGKPFSDLADSISYPPAGILSEIAQLGHQAVAAPAPEWDAFISHASEDKDDFVEPLARELHSRGLNIWYDNFTLTLGDSLRRSIDRGLAHSKFGIVILSPTFFAKEWPQKELDGLVAREVDGRKVILPVWHRLGSPEIRAYSPILADRLAVPSSRGVAAVADAIMAGMGTTPPSDGNVARYSSSPPKETFLPAAAHHPATQEDGVIIVDGNVEAWAQRAVRRFTELRNKRIDTNKGDPFQRGYWQASFALQGQLRDVGLSEFLELLRRSKTRRTGWDVGWVPNRDGIAAYPFENGIEVWMAEEGGNAAGHSDFWRAERVGTFSLFRGYEEDEATFSDRFPHFQFDFSLMLWRIAEVLLYAESFASNLLIGITRANIAIRWTGLENRQLGYHKAFASPLEKHFCRQDTVESRLHIADTDTIRRTLVQDVGKLTRPLFEIFDFFSVTDDDIKKLLKGLFDADTESV